MPTPMQANTSSRRRSSSVPKARSGPAETRSTVGSRQERVKAARRGARPGCAVPHGSTGRLRPIAPRCGQLGQARGCRGAARRRRWREMRRRSALTSCVEALVGHARRHAGEAELGIDRLGVGPRGRLAPRRGPVALLPAGLGEQLPQLAAVAPASVGAAAADGAVRGDQSRERRALHAPDALRLALPAHPGREDDLGPLARRRQRLEDGAQRGGVAGGGLGRKRGARLRVLGAVARLRTADVARRRSAKARPRVGGVLDVVEAAQRLGQIGPRLAEGQHALVDDRGGQRGVRDRATGRVAHRAPRARRAGPGGAGSRPRWRPTARPGAGTR